MIELLERGLGNATKGNVGLLTVRFPRRLAVERVENRRGKKLSPSRRLEYSESRSKESERLGAAFARLLLESIVPRVFPRVLGEARQLVAETIKSEPR